MNEDHTSSEKSKRQRYRKKKRKSVEDTERSSYSFEWPRPEVRSWFEDRMDYKNSADKEQGKLEAKMLLAGAEVTISSDHVKVSPRIHGTKNMVKWRKKCEEILGNHFSGNTNSPVPSSPAESSGPMNSSKVGATPFYARSHTYPPHGIEPIQIYQEHERSKRKFLKFSFYQLSRLDDRFIHSVERNNSVRIIKCGNGISIEGLPDRKQEAVEILISEVSRTKHGYVPVPNSTKPLIQESVSELNQKYPDLQVATECVPDEIILTGHPKEVDIFEKFILKKVAEVTSKNIRKTIHVAKRFHRNIIGVKGKYIKQLLDTYKVHINIPSNLSESCDIEVQGPKHDVEAALRDIDRLVKSIEFGSRANNRNDPEFDHNGIWNEVTFMQDTISPVSGDYDAAGTFTTSAPEREFEQIRFAEDDYSGPSYLSPDKEKQDIGIEFVATGAMARFPKSRPSEIEYKPEGFAQDVWTTISFPISPPQGLAILYFHKGSVMKDLKRIVGDIANLAFERVMNTFIIEGNGNQVMEAHVKVVENLQKYNEFRTLEIAIRNFNVVKFTGGKKRINLSKLNKRYGVDIKYAKKSRHLSEDDRTSFKIIGKQETLKILFKELKSKYGARKIGYHEPEAPNQIRRQESNLSNDSFSLLSPLEHDDPDAFIDESVTFDYKSFQCVFYQWNDGDQSIVEFIKKSPTFYLKLRNSFSSDISILIKDDSICFAGTTFGDTEHRKQWTESIRSKLNNFFNGFKSCKIHFHPKTVCDKRDIFDDDLTVTWSEDPLIASVCGVKDQVKKKLEEFESIKNRKKVVQASFPCEKHLIRFMRQNLQVEDDMSFIDCGRIRLSYEEVEFSSEILEIESSEEWNNECELIFNKIMNGLTSERIPVPPIYCGSMRSQCKETEQVVVEWLNEHSELLLYGYKESVLSEKTKLEERLKDLITKKKSVCTNYQSGNEEILTFIRDSPIHIKNFVDHIQSLGSPQINGKNVTIRGEIFEHNSVSDWESNCRKKIKEFLEQFKSTRMNVSATGDVLKHFTASTKPSKEVTLRWIERHQCYYVVGIKELVDATVASIMEREKQVTLMEKKLTPKTQWHSKKLPISDRPSEIPQAIWRSLTEQLPTPDKGIRWNRDSIKKLSKNTEVPRGIECVIEDIPLRRYGIYTFLSSPSTRSKLKAIEISQHCDIHLEKLPSNDWGDEQFIQLPMKSRKSISIEVVDGDITTQDVDVIVNTTNKQFSFDGPYSRYVLGQARISTMNHNLEKIAEDIQSSAGGLLKSRKIFHVAIPYENESMEELLRKTLQIADDLEMTSIAFPAIGTGSGGWKSEKVAVSMRNAFNGFKKHCKNLKVIRVILSHRIPLDDRKPFYKHVKLENPEVSNISTSPSDLISRIFKRSCRSRQSSGTCVDLVGNKSTMGCYARVMIAAGNEKRLSKAVSEFDNLIASTVNESLLKSTSISELSQADVFELEKITSVHQVRSILDKEKHTITIQGNAPDVARVRKQFQEVLDKRTDGSEVQTEGLWEADELENFSNTNIENFHNFCQAAKSLFWEEVRLEHSQLTEDAMNLIIKAVKCSGVDEFHLRDSSVSVELLQPLCAIDGGNFSISQFSITGEDDITQVIPSICKILQAHNTTSLNVSENNLTDDAILTLKENFIKTPVPSLTKLDISNNEEISDYATLGGILHCNKMSELCALNCGISARSLRQLWLNLPEKLSRLDLSYNAEMNCKSFSSIGNLLKKNSDFLGLSECEITGDQVVALFDSLVKEGITIKALDLSYNPNLRYSGVKFLAASIRKCQISELSLAGCNLDGDCIVALKNNLKGYKIKKLDLSDNSPMEDETLEYIGELTAVCPVEDLDLSNSALSCEQLLMLSESFGDYKIPKLNISDDQVTLDESIVDAITDLAIRVEDELTICYANIETHFTALKQELLKPLEERTREGLRIVYGYHNYQREIFDVLFLPKARLRKKCLS